VLLDEQVRLGPRGVEHYMHQAHVVSSSLGVAVGSEISIAFDPSYERLVLHRIGIRRAGKERDMLDARSIRTFYQENEAEQRVYNGTMTALAVLDDVRAGDLVDVEYTIEGANPVFGGAFAGAFSLARWLPVEQLRYRLLFPTSRSIAVSSEGVDISPTTRELSDYRELSWRRDRIAALEEEGDTPPSFHATPRVQLSEYSSWHDVAVWASGLFAAPPGGDRAVLEKADEIRRAHPDLEAQALAAVRFVQDEVRYLGIEMGESSHRPHSAGEVLAKRFGDCKDKALLIVELLRALGLSANVALVDSQGGRRLDPRFPTPRAFNHVIVRAEVGGGVRWIDATIRDQGGRLSELYVPSYGFALVVAPETTALTRVEPPAEGRPTTSVREVYDVSNAARPARLEVETTYLGADADRMRATLAAERLAEVARGWLNDYAQSEPTIRSDRDVEVSDDRLQNRVVIREHYLIPGYVRDEQACFTASALLRPLRRPRTPLRTSPLRVEFPFIAHHEVELHLPQVLSIPEDVTLSSSAVSFSRHTDDLGSVVRTSFDLRTHTDAVAAADVAEHLRLLDLIRESVAPCVGAALAPGSSGFSLPTWWPWALGGVLMLSTSVVGAIRLPRWMRARRWKRKQSIAKGEAPANPIDVRSRDDAARDIGRRKCACGAAMNVSVDGDGWGTIRLGERTITSVAWSCACGRITRRYYVIRGGGAS
jgi:transglutaminase-like putative cysteine protease